MKREDIWMTWTRGAAALALCLAASTAAWAVADEPAPSAFSSKELKDMLVAAASPELGCNAFPEVLNCEKAADLYRKAAALPGTTVAERHFIDGKMVALYVSWIRNLRVAGQGQAAEDLSARAFQDINRHFDGGKHFHVLIESLPLQGEIVVTLESRGRRDDALRLLKEARDHAERVYQARGQAAGNPSRMRLILEAIYGSYSMEREVADGYARLSEREGGARQSDEQAARERARNWMNRFVEQGFTMSGEDPRIILAETEMDVGDFHWATKNQAAARRSYAAAAAIACPLAKMSKPVLRAETTCEEASTDPVAQRRGGRLRRRNQDLLSE